MASAYCAAHVTDNLVEWVGTLGVVSESGDLKIEYTTVAKKYAVEALFILHDLVKGLLPRRR
tara:strand:- start:9777 stop:9962 length:186 start_codon:yes stop_codon:yes gene_type:complete